MSPIAGSDDLAAPPAVFPAFEADDGVAIPKLYRGTGTGLRYRLWEFEEWCRQYGHFNSLALSHAWHYFGMIPATEYCQAAVMCAEVRCDCDDHWGANVPCQNIGDLMYLGVCLLCDWEADLARDDENLAAEDAMDHAWPGWRDRPVVTPRPDDRKKQAAWEAKIRELYPPGWLEQGGPILTSREFMGSRHVPGRSGYGGYDMGVVRPGSEEEWNERMAFVQADLAQKLAEEIG